MAARSLVSQVLPLRLPTPRLKFEAVSVLLLFIIFKANAQDSYGACVMWIKVFAVPGNATSS